MSVSRFTAAMLGVLAISACSQKPSAGGSPPSAPTASPDVVSAATTIPIPANQEVSTQVALPAGTHKVGLQSGAGSFSCKFFQITSQGGGVSNNFTDADVPAKLNMSDSTPANDPYLAVKLDCRGGAADSQWLITPSP
jgi:hypothetical protein